MYCIQKDRSPLVHFEAIRSSTTRAMLCRTFHRKIPCLLLLQIAALMHIINALSQTTPSHSQVERRIEGQNKFTKAKNISYLSRKDWISSLVATTSSCILSSSLYVDVAKAAETVGKDPECNDSSCLGVW